MYYYNTPQSKIITYFITIFLFLFLFVNDNRNRG
jgi:hypothetical protein